MSVGIFYIQFFFIETPSIIFYFKYLHIEIWNTILISDVILLSMYKINYQYVINPVNKLLLVSNLIIMTWLCEIKLK